MAAIKCAMSISRCFFVKMWYDLHYDITSMMCISNNFSRRAHESSFMTHKQHLTLTRSGRRHAQVVDGREAESVLEEGQGVGASVEKVQEFPARRSGRSCFATTSSACRTSSSASCRSCCRRPAKASGCRRCRCPPLRCCSCRRCRSAPARRSWRQKKRALPFSIIKLTKYVRCTMSGWDGSKCCHVCGHEPQDMRLAPS